MAEALPIDRELVKALWLQGFGPADIERKTGVRRTTLRTWVARLGWKREGGEERAANQAAQDVTVQGVAERLSQGAITQAERIMRCMRETELETLNDCKTSATALAAAYSTARKALGLDDGAVSRHVHVHLMQRAHGSATIDVESSVQGGVEPTLQPPRVAKPLEPPDSSAS